MHPPGIEELERELAATDESYIQRKLALRYYHPDHIEFVKAWLDEREKERVREHAARELATSKRAAFWTMIGAWGSIGAIVVAVVASKLAL
jgi:pyridoxine/pyridoxamine 5'-phosphate oxidase